MLELRADGTADDTFDFTSAVFRALTRVCEERGWLVTVREIDEDLETAGVQRAVLAIDGSTGDVAAS